MLEILAQNQLGKGDIKKYFRQISQGEPNSNKWADLNIKKWLKAREEAKKKVKLVKRVLPSYD